MNYTAKKKRRWQERMKALEEEHRKIQVFHRELPLSLELVNQDIENCKQQLYFSRSEEQTSREEGPVLEEFMPLKRSFSSSQEEVEEESDRTNGKIGQKEDWLRSVQLWNQTPDPLPPSKEVIEKKRRVGAFHPFRKDEEVAATTTIGTKKTTTMPMASTSSTTDNNDRRVQVEKEEQSKRKVRRSWSNELHQKFLHALQQLGGSHAATPKQIREFMKVDGLTNDEVKSHLQKYRLHTTRPSPPTHNNGNPQPTQYVLVGGIWPPPAEYAPTVVTKVDTTMKMKATKGVYVPIAISPQLTLASYPHHHQQQQKQLYSEERSSRAEYSVGDNNGHSSSPTSSSSTHSTTASPTF